MTHELIICSGGLDSVTLAYHVQAAVAPGKLTLVTFNYGQRHSTKEIVCAQAAARRLGATWRCVDLRPIGDNISASALLNRDMAVPHGHYAEDNMKLTVVPNRNAIMLSVAFGIAAAHGASNVWAAFHAGDHFIYPDCRPEFTEAFSAMEQAAMAGMWSVGLMTPFILATKAEIAGRAGELDVPLHETWSCYEGGERHCGCCGTCVERLEAIFLAGLELRDQTEYADREFWRTKVEKGKASSRLCSCLTVL